MIELFVLIHLLGIFLKSGMLKESHVCAMMTGVEQKKGAYLDIKAPLSHN